MSVKTRREAKADRIEELLDEALAESFPASDPAALVAPGGGISGAEDESSFSSRRTLPIQASSSGTAAKKASLR